MKKLKLIILTIVTEIILTDLLITYFESVLQFNNLWVIVLFAMIFMLSYCLAKLTEEE